MHTFSKALHWVCWLVSHRVGDDAGKMHAIIMPPLFASHRDRQLVFLTEEEKASLAQVNPYSSEPSESCLLERLFSSDISSVYRLGKGTTGSVKGFYRFYH